jgi:hypothetical protein
MDLITEFIWFNMYKLPLDTIKSIDIIIAISVWSSLMIIYLIIKKTLFRNWKMYDKS